LSTPFGHAAGTLLVTNRASLVPNPAGLFAISDVFVDDKAGKLCPGGAS